MNTTIHNCQQGSPDWLKLREDFDTASEAPASQGKSKYTSRSDLLKKKATGLSADVGAAKQALFDRGHASEESSRSIAERLLDDDLYPITATAIVDGINLLASLDGATMDRKIIWEHKLYSEKLAADVRAGNLDPHYTIQMDQQLLVTGAKKCMFMTSDGTEENMAWCWYESNQEKFDALIFGWHQFHADLAAYVPPEPAVKAVAAPQFGLPAVSIQVNGSIALIDNLQVFGAALTAYIERINKSPETDQDFADLEATVKTLKNAEDALDAAESGALAQTDSIDTMRRTVAMYRDTARANRLLIDKLVKSEKENRRTAIVSEAAAELVSHVNALSKRIGQNMPIITSNFPMVVKGLKSIDSMRDKVAVELARCKIEANAAADHIAANLKAIDQAEFQFLFSDRSMLALKDHEYVAMAIKNRVADHQAKETARLEFERTRIAEQERVKAEAAAQARADAEIAAAARKAADERAAEQARQYAELEQAETKRLANLNASLIVEAAPVCSITTPWLEVPAVVQAAVDMRDATADIIVLAGDKVTVPIAKPDTAPTLKLGTICTRFGIEGQSLQLTAAFLSALGFEPAATDRASKLYHADDFQAIGRALIEHIETVLEGVEA